MKSWTYCDDIHSPGEMSLTSFIAAPDVAERLKPLRPNMPRKIGAALQVEPRSVRYALVGTAFDYFLRFELQRRAPHAITEPWVAEHVPYIIWHETGSLGVGRDILHGVPPGQGYLPPEEIAERARRIIVDARAAVSAHVKASSPTRASLRQLAAHAIRLAKLDSVVRSGQLDPEFEHADEADVEDLIALLAIVPFGSLLDPNTMLLNPTFGEASKLVGGADADLISGNFLVDFKVTKLSVIDTTALDQLLGYFLLGRYRRHADKSFPDIKRVGVYFARHGHLWPLDVNTWLGHPQFLDIEKWFFERSARKLGQSKVIRRPNERKR